IEQLVKLPQGLILVTGPTGSGKSTTQAAMLDAINRNRALHIITIEDPIEYVHQHHRSIVQQREVGVDTPTFAEALRSALRDDPVRNLLHENKTAQIRNIVATSAREGMNTLEASLSALVAAGWVQYSDAVGRSMYPTEIRRTG